MKCWKPVNARNTLDQNGLPTNLTHRDLHRIATVLEDAYAPSTRGTYGTGLLTFHLFCDLRNITEEHRAPIDPTILATFISNLIDIYGGNTIKNFVYGIRAWHIIHGTPWRVVDHELQALLTAGNRRAPKDSKRDEKQPWTIDYLEQICRHLNANDPKDAAILACLTTTFWSTARLGEVTVENLKSFNPQRHVKVSDVRFDVPDRNNLTVTEIFIPWTKSSREKGETIFWGKQRGITDPQEALTNHLRVNKLPRDCHLFAYRHERTFRPMTKPIFRARVYEIASENKMEKISCHGIRIGSTLEYLLRGLPFDVVKSKGRWQSDAFKGYLRKHAQIMTPYMQEDPRGSFESFIHYAMPPVR